jgi:predicted TIM-barrel fold metal-dependent hydrolase
MAIGHTDGAATPVIDASVHIFFASNHDFRSFMHEPYRSRGIPDVLGGGWGRPGGQWAADAKQTGESFPASDPDVTGDVLFNRRGVDIAVLHPMTRGVLPDRHLTSAMLAAHNEMLVSRWLDSGRFADRYRGTVRLNPQDISGALRELNRWKDHPKVVQIGLPMQTREPYGKPEYWPLFEAAEAAGLPVAVHMEMGNSLGFPPTPSGQPRTYEQYMGFSAFNYLYHLMNMIAEGVFERYPNLKVVWADGAADMLTPFIWRMDVFGRPHLEQTPWAPRMPSDYLPGHVYFVQGALDGPGDTDFAGEWLGFTGKDNMVMFGSSYPDWQLNDPNAVAKSLSQEQRDKLLWRNAADLYNIEIPAAAVTR